MRSVVLLASALPRGTVRLVRAVVAAVVLVAPVLANAEATEAGAAPDAVSAVWTPQELRFKLDDSRTEYTCEKLRDRVKRTLLALGARKDLKVDTWPCMNTPLSFFGGRNMGTMRMPDGPSVDPQVAVRMQVLKVSAEPRPDPDGIPAHWKSVDLMDKDGPLGTSDCTLAKRIAESLLPLFSTRNVDYSSPTCDRVGNPPDVHLRLEVPVADPR